jgi:Domain of unknown function (DUF4124)
MVFGSWAAQQTFYKSVQPDGRVVYGDAPAKGAVRTDKITVPVDNIGSEADAAAAKRTLQMNRQELLKNIAARNARRDRLEIEISDAYRRVKLAEAALESGRSVGVGDRQGKQLTPQYWDRQRKLGIAVRQAQTALDRLMAERDSLR